MYKILVSDKLGQAGLDRLSEAQDAVYDMKTGLSPEELAATIPDYDALIIRSGTKVTADIFAAATNLKVVGRAGIGIDNIDIREATMRGVIVMNTPGANSIATAEQTMALMLAASRHTGAAHQSLSNHEWKRSKFVGIQLYRKVLGVIGFGRIGRLVAKRCQAFGMDVIAYDPYVSEEIGRELGVTLVDLDDLFSQADYITMHTALLPETEKMINAETLSQMKDGVVIVNAARGKLIDEQALAEALKSGKVRAAGLDVFSSEPPPGDHPLVGLDNVVHTPHVAASTIEAQRDVATQIVDQVLDALRGDDFRNALNLPFSAGPDFADTQPYMRLAEKLGSLHANLAEGFIRRVEISAHGEAVNQLIRPIASALLKGMLEKRVADSVNYINAPILADEHGITITQTAGLTSSDYPNIISSKVITDDKEWFLAGVLFGGKEPRIVKMNDHDLEARPEGTVLVMENQDVPGVVGQIGTILGAYQVNIAEWRMGRNRPGGEALSFLNLDSAPPDAAVNALSQISAVTYVKIVTL